MGLKDRFNSEKKKLGKNKTTLHVDRDVDASRLSQVAKDFTMHMDNIQRKKDLDELMKEERNPAMKTEESQYGDKNLSLPAIPGVL